MLSDRIVNGSLRKSVRHFWATRSGQVSKQRSKGNSDQGERGAVTGGKQMDGFVALVARIVTKCGLPSSCIFLNSRLELPGYFRPEKKWDLLVVDENVLLAAIEFKSQVGPSFGNNFNNRSEEAIGTAQDLWTAYREGAFSTSVRPWLGYLMLLEECEKSTSPVAVRESHFPVFSEFVGASYSSRYQILLTKLMRERLYDSTCFLTSPNPAGPKVSYDFPDRDLHFKNFQTSLQSRIQSHVDLKS